MMHEQTGKKPENNHNKRKALIMAVSDYTDLQKLDFCKNDGQEMYNILSSLGYEILEDNKLIGDVSGDKIKDKIYDFFYDVSNKPDDTLLLYYTGHGVPDKIDDIYLGSSDIDPDQPFRKGFSFEQLTRTLQGSISTRIIAILDCCYSGAAKLTLGQENDAATMGTKAIEHKSRNLDQGQGKYILAASQAAQEAYALAEGNHSIFSYYLLQGLKGTAESVDRDGNVTPQTLGKYIYRSIMSLPVEKRPKQKPITKAEESGDIILASYPQLKLLKRKEYLKLLLLLVRNGKVEEFNKIREQNPDIPLDFSGQDLHRVHVAGINFSRTNLSRTNLTKAVLKNVNLHKSNLFKADLEGANLTNANISEATLDGVILSNANLSNANLSNANLSNANLSNSNLFKANLGHTILIETDLRKTDLTDCDTTEANFTGAILQDSPISSSNEGKNSKLIVPIIGVGIMVLIIAIFGSGLIHSNSVNMNEPLNVDQLLDKRASLIQLGNYTEVISYYDKILAKDPRNKYALSIEGLALDSLGNYTGAISYYNKALAIDPKYKFALYSKAKTLDHLNKYTGTRSTPYHHNSDNPGIPLTVVQLIGKGLALTYLGNYTGAISYYNKALAIDPTNTDALTYKSNALNNLGNYTRAKYYHDKAFVIDPPY